jgi:signal transduction histidine kinase
LLLMALLLGFLQYTYWDLSRKRQEATSLKNSFIALAEADMAAKGMLASLAHLQSMPASDSHRLEEIEEISGYFSHLATAGQRLQTYLPPDAPERAALLANIAALDPQQGFDSERMIAAIKALRPQLAQFAELTQKQRERLRSLHSEDIEDLVARTTFVSIVVLGIAILVGVFLSLAFARRILRRIKTLSVSAGLIAAGGLEPPPAPERAADELDDLAISINRMTERLIRVVSTEKLLEGAEEERRRIARDIHDQTLSDLSSVLRGLQDLHQTSNVPACADAGHLAEELRKSIANLREVMDDLHPQTLDILGLGAALQSHLEKHRERPGTPELHCYISPELETRKLPRLTQVTLYRIAIEALHNVLKHAGASRCELVLSCDTQRLTLSVEDNGCGFLQTPAPTGGRGLNNMRERARAIGADVSWGPSRFSSGTRFQLSLSMAPALAS